MNHPGGGRNLVRAVHWRRLDTPASEYFALAETGTGWELQGTVVATLQGEPVLAAYAVRCGPNWETQEVEVLTTSGAGSHRLRLTVENGRWASGEGPLGALEGATDVDLGVTPSTNTLPIRRLNLHVGEDAELAVTWVRFPDLAVERWTQRYTRLAENLYCYQSDSFSRDLEVDEHGLVISYPDYFVRESVLDG